MTEDLELELRDRLRRAGLPAAPDVLRVRLGAVVAARPASRLARPVTGNQVRWLLPLAAVLLIGGGAILTGGGNGPRPPSATSSPGWDDPTPHAELVIAAAVYQWCGPVGCRFDITLDGPDDKGIQTGRLEYSELGAAAPIDPAMPAKLATGAYILRAEIHAIGDAIPEGASGPPDLGTTATCEAGFIVYPGASVVTVTMGFWLDRCSVGALVTDDTRSLTSLSVVPTVKGACGADLGGCDYRLTLTGGINSTWMATTQTVFPGSQLVINELTPWLVPGGYQLIASAHQMSKEPEPFAGHQQELGVAAGCDATFLVDEDMTNVDIGIVFQDESCTISTTTQPATTPRPTFELETPAEIISFEAPYGDSPPEGATVLPDYVVLTADRRRALVDFVSNGTSRAGNLCTTNVSPWVHVDGDVLEIILVRTSSAVPTACQPTQMGGAYVRYDLELPSVFLGTTYRVGNGELYAFP